MTLHEPMEELEARLERITRYCPALLPVFIAAVEAFEELDIEIEDVEAVLRVCRRSPAFVRVLLRLVDVAQCACC